MLTNPRTRAVVAWILTAPLVVLFFFQGTVKIMMTEREKDLFQNQFGYPLWFMVIVGLVELASVALLLFPRLAGWACGAICVVMIGATYSHIVLQGLPARASLPVAMFALAFALGVLRAHQTLGLPARVKRWFPHWAPAGGTSRRGPAFQ